MVSSSGIHSGSSWVRWIRGNPLPPAPRARITWRWGSWTQHTAWGRGGGIREAGRREENQGDHPYDGKEQPSRGGSRNEACPGTTGCALSALCPTPGQPGLTQSQALPYRILSPSHKYTSRMFAFHSLQGSPAWQPPLGTALMALILALPGNKD